MTTNAVAGPVHGVTEHAPTTEKSGANVLQRAMQVRIGIIPLPIYLVLGIVWGSIIVGIVHVLPFGKKHGDDDVHSSDAAGRESSDADDAVSTHRGNVAAVRGAPS